MIRAEGLHFAYPGGREAVAGIDLELSKGAMLAVIGPNGSGKSTLLKLLAGILTPSRGALYLEGRPLSSYGRQELARLISYVPQQATVGLPFTAGEVVLLGRHPYQSGFHFESKEDLQAVRRALELTEALELAPRIFHSLSGGERQRVLIARAIAQDARLLLLDEPTAALDLKHEVRAWEILERLVADEAKTVVSVTHHLNLAAAYSPRLLILKDGRTAAAGPPQELVRRELMEAVYETAVHVERPPDRAPFIIPERARRG